MAERSYTEEKDAIQRMCQLLYPILPMEKGFTACPGGEATMSYVMLGFKTYSCMFGIIVNTARLFHFYGSSDNATFYLKEASLISI